MVSFLRLLSTLVFTAEGALMEQHEGITNVCYMLTPAVMLVVLAFPLSTRAQMTSVGVDCSQIPARQIWRQDNLRASIILQECGLAPGTAKADSSGSASDQEPAPPNILVSNRQCTSSGTCTKSESSVWHSSKVGDHTVVVNFNDIDNQLTGTAYSTDDGATFTQIVPPPFTTGHSFNYGDPIVAYNQKLNLWFAGDLVTGCGGFGIGLWTSPDGQHWTTGACAHSGDNDDRPSMWVDNNPFSRRYGRMYVSWNDYDFSGAIVVSHSDDGNTWSTPVQVSSTFERDVQLTGTLPGPPPPNAGFTSTVFVVGMDEGSGGFDTRQNLIYRSTDGGVTWTAITMGPRFNPPGDQLCASRSYFPIINPIWRLTGYGQPAVGPNGVVHYVYAGKGSLSGGDIFYTRSTNNGSTWSTPIILNDPETNQYQSHWMPSVSVNYNLAGFRQPEDVTVYWYDRRNATTVCNVITDPGCEYQVYGVQSTDNGTTWGANFAISSGLINQPSAPPIDACYAGDYNYSTALGGTAFVTWTDGRVAVGGVQVQNVDFAGTPEP